MNMQKIKMEQQRAKLCKHGFVTFRFVVARSGGHSHKITVSKRYGRWHCTVEENDLYALIRLGWPVYRRKGMSWRSSDWSYSAWVDSLRSRPCLLKDYLEELLKGVDNAD